MAEHPNVAIARNAYESFAKGDLDGALTDLADDCVFHFGGDGPNSGDHKGREAIAAALIKNFELTAGTWALDIANCKTPQDSQDAPLVIAKDRYDQHEVHCTFKSVDAKESDYKVAGDCTVEGYAQSYDFTLTVSGDTLTFTDEAGARDFLRCK